MTDFNENYVERFSRRKPPPDDSHPQPDKQPGPKLELNIGIRDYVKSILIFTNAPPYVFQREIPTSTEISVPESDEAFEIPLNQVVGPWESKRKYLSDHYALLREDAVTPLRNVVSELKAEPHILEQDSIEHACIYEKVLGEVLFELLLPSLMVYRRFSLSG